MASARKLPSGAYRVLVYSHTDKVDGKPVRRYQSFTASTAAEAEFQAAEFKRRKQRIETHTSMTLREGIDAYLALKDHVLSPTTIAEYRKMRDLRFQSIMDKPMEKLTQQDVQLAVNEESAKVSRRGKPLSPKTIKNAHGLLSAVLATYCPDLHLRTTLPAPKKQIKELLRPEVIMDAVKGTDIELPVLLAMWLSFSKSEIRGLKKTAVRDGYIVVEETVVDVDGKPVHKNQAKAYDRIRKHKIPTYIAGLIEKAIASTPGDYLVNMEGYTIYNKFKRALQKAGLPHMNFHDLRHVSASVMLMLGVPDKYAMERGGWSTPHTMKAVYQHTFSEERKAVDKRIDDYFESIMQHEMQHESKNT